MRSAPAAAARRWRRDAAGALLWSTPAVSGIICSDGERVPTVSPRPDPASARQDRPAISVRWQTLQLLAV